MSDDRFMLPANVFLYSQSYKGSEVRYKYYSDLTEAINDAGSDAVIIALDKNEEVPFIESTVGRLSANKHVRVFFLGEKRRSELLFALSLTGGGVDTALGMGDRSADAYDVLDGLEIQAITSGNNGVYSWNFNEATQEKIYALFGHASCYAVVTPCEDDGFGGGQFMYGSKGSIGIVNAETAYAPSGTILVYDLVAGVSTPAWLPAGVTCQLAVFITPL